MSQLQILAVWVAPAVLLGALGWGALLLFTRRNRRHHEERRSGRQAL